MAVLYLTEQQAWVGREGGCLVVHIPVAAEDTGKVGENLPSAKRERKLSVPLSKVEEVVVLGDITLSTAALTTLLEAKIQVTYLSKYGHYLGSLNPEFSKNSLLRLAQYGAYVDKVKRHELARSFVVGKLRNMRTVLMRYNRAIPEAEVSNQVESLKRCIQAAQKAELSSDLTKIDLENADPELEPGEIEYGRMNGLGPLLGCEGAGSAAYFGVFARLIKCDWAHGFSRRARRPPTDPVNAMLSYGYTILGGQVGSAAATIGFDPHVGWLHSSRYGKPALALDLLEEFRPLIVDSVVLSLLNNRQLGQSDFKPELNSYRMSDGARRIFLQKFEERMQEVIVHPFFEYKATYRRCIELQARLLSKYLMGEISEYVPFTVR